MTLHADHSWTNATAFSPDGKLLATGGTDKAVRLWNVATGQLLRTLTGHSDNILHVVFSPDGKQIASASSDKTIRLWDVATGKNLAVLKAEDQVSSIAYNPDEKLLASADNITLRIWDTSTDKELATLHGHTGKIWSVAFSSDSKILASAGEDGTIRLWGTSVKGNGS